MLLVAAIACLPFATGMNTPAAPQVSVLEPQEAVVGSMSVVSIEPVFLYASDGVELIIANGKQYLKTEQIPIGLSGYDLTLEGNHVDWIDVYKVGSDRLPVMLKSYKPNVYLLDSHEGAGVYHVRSEAETGESLWAAFEIKGEVVNPPDGGNPDGPGDNDPPKFDHSKLQAILDSQTPADPAIANPLGEYYLAAASSIAGDAFDLRARKTKSNVDGSNE
ncbi:MAG: hypothetical protein R3C03_23925 [Pirellulaceae bacterium]